MYPVLMTETPSFSFAAGTPFHLGRVGYPFEKWHFLSWSDACRQLGSWPVLSATRAVPTGHLRRRDDAASLSERLLSGAQGSWYNRR